MLSVLLLTAALFGIDLDAESARLHLETGLAYIQQGLLEQAVEELETTLSLDPDCHEAHLALGRLRARMGDPESAEERLLRFSGLAPEDHRGPLALARLYIDTGRGAEALEQAESALMLRPTSEEVWLELARAEELCGDTAAAAAWLVRVVEEGGTLENEARVREARLLRGSDRLREARAVLLPAAAEDHPPAIWGLARVYLAWEDWMRASGTIRRYLRLEPAGRWSDSARMELRRLSEEGLYIPAEGE